MFDSTLLFNEISDAIIKLNKNTYDITITNESFNDEEMVKRIGEEAKLFFNKKGYKCQYEILKTTYKYEGRIITHSTERFGIRLEVFKDTNYTNIFIGVGIILTSSLLIINYFKK
jgi:hypothetical protein